MAVAGAGRSSPPLRVPRGSEVSLTQPRVTLARDTDMDFSHDDAPISNPLVESQPTHSELGPWMIVSRRRGHVCGRGTGLCAGHVTSDVAATGNTSLLGPHAGSAGGTHGAHRGRGCGIAHSSRAFHAEYINTDGIPMGESLVENPCGVTTVETLSPHSPVTVRGVKGSARGGCASSHASHVEFQSLH